MTRRIKGSVGSRRFGVLFLLAALAAGALLVTASVPDSPGTDAVGAFAPLDQGQLLLQENSMFVPAAAHVSGAAGTNWRTDVEVYNAGQQTAQYRIALLRKNQNNSNPVTMGFNLLAGQSVRYNDILQSVFQFDGSASLWITVQSGEVIVSSRTYNETPDGTYGQYIGGALEAQAIQQDQEGRIIQLTHNRANNQGFRTNVGFLNCTSLNINVQVRLYSWNGSLIGTRTYGLEPYMYTQIDRIFEQVTQSDVSDGYVIVETFTPGGKFFAYASVVDNRTGDPIYIPAVLIGGGGPNPTPTPTPTNPGVTSTPTRTPTRTSTGVPPTATPTYTPTQTGANVNLRPFQPSGWDGPLVASGVAGTNVSGGLVGGQTTFIDWAVINEGSETAVFPAGSAIAQIDLDGVPFVAWAQQSDDYLLESGFYVFVEDYETTGIAAGAHTLRLSADPDGAVPETNEGDNSWDFNGTWSSAKSTDPSPLRTEVIGAHQLRKAPIPGFGAGMAWGRPIEEIQHKRRLAGLNRGGQPTGRVAKSTAEPVYIPAAAHVAGAAGTNWRTDVELHNPGGTQAQYEIALLRRNQANPQPVTVVFSVAIGQCLRLSDVLFSTFGVEGGAALRIVPLSGEVIVTSRTYNLTDEGTYGQFIGGAPVSEAIQHGQSAVLIQLTQNDDYRANLGFVSASASPITVRADMYRSDGLFLGTRNYQLEAYMHRQIDRAFQQVTDDDVTDGYIVVSTVTPGGEFFAYTSVVDNATGDPVYIPAIISGGATAPTPTPTPTGPGPTVTPTPTVGPGVPLDPLDAMTTIFEWLGTLGQGDNLGIEEWAAQIQTIGLQGVLNMAPTLLPGGVVTVGTNRLDFDFPPGYESPAGVLVSGTASVQFTNVNTTAPNLSMEFSGTQQSIQLNGQNLAIDTASGNVDLMTGNQGHVVGSITFSGTGGTPKGTKSLSTVTGNPEINTEICPNYPIAGQIVLEQPEGSHQFGFDDSCDGTFVYIGPGGTGALAFRLRWDGPQDLDLYVTEPNGETIYYGSRTSSTGGALDVDANAGCSGPASDPTENIFWENEAPVGTYEYWGDLWSDCDATSTPHVTLFVIVNGVIHRVIETEISGGETQHYTHQHPPPPAP